VALSTITATWATQDEPISTRTRQETVGGVLPGPRDYVADTCTLLILI